MSECSPESAIAAALDAMQRGTVQDVAPGERFVADGEAVLVRRLDDSSRSYYLMKLRSSAGGAWIAEVERPACRLAKAAVLRPATPLLPVSAAVAVQAVQAAPLLPVADAVPWLGWRPCAQSFDSFLPFWVIATQRGEVFVDQRGAVHRQLTEAGRGG